MQISIGSNIEFENEKSHFKLSMFLIVNQSLKIEIYGCKLELRSHNNVHKRYLQESFLFN